MALNVVSALGSSMTHLGSLERNQFLKGNGRFLSQKNNIRRAPSPSTIKCFKGVLVPPPDLLDPLLRSGSGNGGVAPSVIPKTEVVTRKDFPVDFKFGCASSALQTESSPTEGGRGPSTWDYMIGDGQAVDSYHRYKDDAKLLKDMGVDVYRFSISWSRILPDGTVNGGKNQAGIDFYNNFINELINNGITPFVTLFHFDLPVALQNKYNGFLNSQIVDDFKAYADFCFQTFGDRVKYWGTINEPQVFGQYGYSAGLSPPDPNPVTNPFVAMHNILLAHATAAKLYKQTYQPTQKGEIGMSLSSQWFLPESDTIQDEDAADRAFDFYVGWILEPLVFGDYPFIMKALVRDALPTFTDEEKALVKGAFDYIGINYYTSSYATAVPLTPNTTYTSVSDYQHATLSAKKNGIPIGDPTPGSDQIYVYPQGLRDVLVYVSKQYNNPKIYITENGYPEKRDDTIPVNVALQDNARIQHILSHLYAVSEALKLGANVNGYFMWALMDCMEVGSGYGVRFGLNYTDYLKNLDRTPKKSAGWMKTFLDTKK